MVTESEYFGRILEWDEKNPDASFAICKDISPLPVVRLEHWQDFQKFIESCYEVELGRDLIFRGQRRYDWKLISTLGRSKISNFDNDAGKNQLDHFRQAIRGRIQDYSLLKEELSEDEKNEIWSIGQHHGLMTPLLDWTYSPYVALFFAFIEEDTIEESLMPNYYRSVYLLDSGYFKNPIKDSEIHIFEPTKDEHGRLVNQDGLFTISPFDIDIETKIADSLYDLFNGRLVPNNIFRMARFACKVYIKNKNREECLQHLDYMNINHKSLFPDLHGSADFCNKKIASFGYNIQKPPVAGGSLVLVSEKKKKEYEKIPLYNEIKKILIKILQEKKLDNDKINMIVADGIANELNEQMSGKNDIVLVYQFEVLAGEIARQIDRLKELPIPDCSYENLMEAKINLILREFDLKGLEYIQSQKAHVVNKIMGIKEIQKMIRANKT